MTSVLVYGPSCCHAQLPLTVLGAQRVRQNSLFTRAWFQASSTAFSCCLIWSCLLLPVGRGAALLFPGSTLGMLSLMPA